MRRQDLEVDDEDVELDDDDDVEPIEIQESKREDELKNEEVYSNPKRVRFELSELQNIGY